MSAAVLVTIVRHGETYMNSQRLIQGHTDAPLSEIGIDQAKRLGRTITSTKFTAAYSSDLQRAYNTAKLILGEQSNSIPDVQKDLRLRERCYGDAEGKPVQNLIERAADAKVSVSDFVATGGESLPEVSRRAGDFFQAITKQYSTSTDEHILVVSHGGWVNSLMKHLYDNTDKYQLKNFSPSQAIRIHYNTGTTVISITPPNSQCTKYELNFLKINDKSHLEDES